MNIRAALQEPLQMSTRVKIGRSLTVILTLAWALSAAAASMETYQAQNQVRGDIRVWGSPEDAQLLKLWDQGFRKHQPDARVVAQLHGPESTIASLYTDVADIAFVGRELRLPTDNMAFQWVKLYPITTVEVANAGLTGSRLAGTIAVFVHPDNPLRGLTLAQLDGIFGGEHKRGAGNLRTWGDLGLSGEWRERPIHVLAPSVDSIAALFFRRVVLENSFKWNTALQEFPSEAAAIAAVARDPSAIAYGRMGASMSGVTALPLAVKAVDAFVMPTVDTVADRSYPLARVVIVAVNRKPGQPLDAKVREFLRYVLSEEGQAAVAQDGAYIPLASKSAQQQLKRLD
jgi:phosphate transport system substrate-binding protein